MNETWLQLERLRGQEERVAMATLVATRGTMPRKEGSKMWVGAAGRILGSVTIGGCVDARVVERSEEVLRSDTPTLLSVELGDEDAREMGLTCAGAVDVRLEPVTLSNGDDPTVRSYERVRTHLERGGRVAIVTPLHGGRERLVVYDHGAVEDSLGDPELDAEAAERAVPLLERGVSRTIDLGDRELFFEVHSPPATLVVFGAGHVAEPLVRLAVELGMRTIVVDGRARLANREAFPDAHEIRVGIPSEVAAELRYGPPTAVVLVAHDYKYDIPVLKAVLETDAGYIGMLGSRRRGETILRMLEEDGLAPETLERVRVPVGLDIGAETAPELALSILAEAVAVRAGRRGGPMRERERS